MHFLFIEGRDGHLLLGLIFYMGKQIDLTGKRFGKLIVIKYSRTENKRAFWWVKCDCGMEAEKMAKYLLNGDTKSCGCILAKDGRTKTRLYKIWSSMMTRCYNKNRRSYKNYGGRGIIVCERWHDFKNFYEDVKIGYSDNLTLDRFPDNNGNYGPSNFRWATKTEQGRNKRNNIIMEYNGESKCFIEWARQYNMDYNTLKCRLQRGWTKEQALNTPIVKKYADRIKTCRK